MDFLERLFGIAHDNGDGSLEAIVLMAVLVIVFGLGIGYFHRHHHVRH
jgi:hypothetical protein